jgi:hypothetical protein
MLLRTIQLHYQLLNENSQQTHHILLMIMAAAPASEQVLNAFNEILNLRRAYTYDRQQVRESLYDAAEVVCFRCVESMLTIGMVDIRFPSLCGR